MRFPNSNLALFIQPFDFSNKDGVELISRRAGLFCVFASAVCNQFIDHSFQVICLHLSDWDFHCLLDLADLMLSIRGLPNLIVMFFSKTNTD